MNVISGIVFVVVAGIGAGVYLQTGHPAVAPVFLVLAALSALSPKVVKQWERAVVLRLGKFRGSLGPGLCWIMPLLERVVKTVDQRVITTSFLAEKALTRDTVPVNVDAVLFWHVWDPKKATLGVADYREAVSWASQTALRDMIGRTELSSLLSNREQLDKQLQVTIDAKTEPWGITVESVEIRDVVIPESLQDAMSRQAQAERERQARIILGDAENQIAGKFVEAARQYAGEPIGLHLRAMNILYESLKERGSLVVVPSTAVESMGLGGLAGLTSLHKTLEGNGSPEEVARTSE